MQAKFRIGKFIPEYLNPYIIAEIGVNHECDIKKAMLMIEQAKRAGAHAAKFQTYKAEKLASINSPAYWNTTKEPTQSQYGLFKKHDKFGLDEYRKLALHCENVGIDFLSTPFDTEAVEQLADLVPAFKIASADITNIPLIRAVKKTGKPVILSTGASSAEEIQFAIDLITSPPASDIALLHCVLLYPTPMEHAQIGYLRALSRKFPTIPIGYSDHVPPLEDGTIPSLELASICGALILEKHFTFDKAIPGNDHYHSMDGTDLLNFTQKIRIYKTLYNDETKNLALESSAILNARRSIVARRYIYKGELISEENVIPKRPGTGISPIHWDSILGKRALNDIAQDSLISWSDLGDND